MYTMNSFISRFESNKGLKIDQSIFDELQTMQTSINKRDFINLKDKYLDEFNEMSPEMKRAARLRQKIEKLERSNKKRRNSIIGLERKYELQEMPEDIRNLIENTKNNLIKGEANLEKYKHRLYELESTENVQLSLW